MHLFLYDRDLRYERVNSDFNQFVQIPDVIVNSFSCTKTLGNSIS